MTILDWSSRRVLIIKMSSIGDVVLALPVATALKRSDPAIHITWAVEDWTAPLVIGHPDVDRVVVFPRMRWSQVSPAWLRRFAAAVRALRARSYDVSIDLQGLARSALLVVLARAPLRLVSALRREGSGLVSQPVPNSDRPHAADEYLRCAQFLGAADEPATFRLPVAAEAVHSIGERLAAHGIGASLPLVVVNPSASSAHRTWRAARWTALLDELPRGAAVVLVGDTGQVTQHRRIVRRCARPPLDLTGQTTLAELVALLNRCAVHISPDTGSVHIAAALGKPVVALYGPTDAARNGPYGQPDPRQGASRPCGPLCPALCRRRLCLEQTTPAELARRAARHLASRAA
jgi:heptosyltransferase-1